MDLTDGRKPGRLPVGELGTSAGGCLFASLLVRDSGYGDSELEHALHRLRALPAMFLRPASIERQPGGWRLDYPAERPRTVSLTQALRAWRRNLAVNVPLILELAQFLLDCDQTLCELALPSLPVSPLLVRYTPQVPEPFRLVVLPAGRIRLGGWAQADAESWLWAAPEVVLNRRPDYPLKDAAGISYSIGAALHEYYCGALLPGILTAQEGFTRLLRGHVGNLKALPQALQAALPASMTTEVETQAVLIGQLMAPEPQQRPIREELEEHLRKLRSELSAHRLATRWEYEGRRDNALDGLNLFADWQAAAAVPWTALARLRERSGDYDGALVAARHAFRHGLSDAPRYFTGFLGRLAAMPHCIFVLRDAVVRLEEASYQIDEGGKLLLAHLEAWPLQDPAAALRRLEEPCRSPWCEALRLLLRARLLIMGDQYEVVSSLCKEGERLIQALPAQGQDGGRYVCAYLALLDAIANYAAVAKYRDPSYYGDAFVRLTHSLQAALDARAEELQEHCLRWLGFLCTVAMPLFPEMQAGAHAYLSLHDLWSRLPLSPEPPDIPLYDEQRLFRFEEPGLA